MYEAPYYQSHWLFAGFQTIKLLNRIYYIFTKYLLNIKILKRI